MTAQAGFTLQNDVFARRTVYGGAMSADMLKLNFTEFTGGEATGLIVQQVQVQYQQQVSRLYALEDSRVYFVVGQTNGQLSLQHAIGPRGIQGAFIRSYGDPCNIGERVFNLSVATGCDTSQEKGKVRLASPLISGIALSLNAGDAIVMSGITASFTSMEIEDSQ